MTREQILKELKESKVSEAIIDECADRIMGLIDNVCPNCDGSGFEIIQKECESCGGTGTIDCETKELNRNIDDGLPF